ncbi:MAG: DUF411 domain-containing protein [Betaproteobacteria bacterium]|nr:DUF411 domain-containing protein [Betaproteobacteria bacterium]
MTVATTKRPTRRQFLGATAAASAWLVAGALAGLTATAHAAGPEVVMHKDPNCGCCGQWAEHLRAAGFRVREQAERDMGAIKRRLGVPPALGSCHTATVGGYVIEGHVPASAITRLLREKPAVAGLSVPGMPPGSPGMESPTPVAYDVVAFDRAGAARVFERRKP